MGKRFECLSVVSLKLKSELNSQKALIAVILPQLTLEQSKQVKTLQTKNEEVNTRLQKLLTKLKVPTRNTECVDASYRLDLGFGVILISSQW